MWLVIPSQKRTTCFPRLEHETTEVSYRICKKNLKDHSGRGLWILRPETWPLPPQPDQFSPVSAI